MTISWYQWYHIRSKNLLDELERVWGSVVASAGPSGEVGWDWRPQTTWHTSCELQSSFSTLYHTWFLNTSQFMTVSHGPLLHPCLVIFTNQGLRTENKLSLVWQRLGGVPWCQRGWRQLSTWRLRVHDLGWHVYMIFAGQRIQSNDTVHTQPYLKTISSHCTSNSAFELVWLELGVNLCLCDFGTIPETKDEECPRKTGDRRPLNYQAALDSAHALRGSE